MIGVHGVRGELVCALLTDFPERFGHTRRVLVGEPPRPFDVERHRFHGGNLLLKLAGLDERTAAEALRGVLIQVPVEEAVTLPPGQYFWHEVVGLRVVDEQGQELGTVAEILATGGNDVYVVKSDRGELLLPAIKDVIKDIDPPRGLMTVELLPGLGC